MKVVCQILFSVETELVYRLNYGPRVYINYGQKVSSGVMSSNKIVNFVVREGIETSWKINSLLSTFAFFFIKVLCSRNMPA